MSDDPIKSLQESLDLMQSNINELEKITKQLEKTQEMLDQINKELHVENIDIVQMSKKSNLN